MYNDILQKYQDLPVPDYKVYDINKLDCRENSNLCDNVWDFYSGRKTNEQNQELDNPDIEFDFDNWLFDLNKNEIEGELLITQHA